MFAAEKGWRAAYLDRESESPLFSRVVGWGTYDVVDDDNGVVQYSGVAALVLAQTDIADDSLCFAEDWHGGEFLGLAEPEQDVSVWFDVATQHMKEQREEQVREELRDLKKLIQDDFAEGWMRRHDNSGRLPMKAQHLEKIMRGDPVLVRSEILDLPPQWMFVVNVYGGRHAMGPGMTHGDMYLDVANIERYVRSGDYEMRIRSSQVAEWRFPKSRLGEEL